MIEAPRAAGPPRVLLVDDDIHSVELLGMLLARCGFEVITACSVDGALAAVAEKPVDVLVSDINLPDGNGYDLLRQLRAAGPLPAIALSGLDGDADITSAREAGFNEYLGKPVSLDALVDAIERVAEAR